MSGSINEKKVGLYKPTFGETEDLGIRQEGINRWRTRLDFDRCPNECELCGRPTYNDSGYCDRCRLGEI